MKRILFFVTFITFLASSCNTNHDRTVKVPMRDGIRLSTRLIFPKTGKKKYPAILVRTPYKKENKAGHYHYLVENGYVLVLQDVRGQFGSEGKFEPFVNENKDGYDAVEWIASQSWSDGNVGMIGTSYDGWVQYCAAVEQPPHLKTIIPNCAVVDLFYDVPYRYGIFTTYSLLWSTIIEENATADITGQKVQQIYDRDWEHLLLHQPVSELDAVVLGKRLDYYKDWVMHDTKDAYWKRGCYLEQLQDIKIPVFIQTGWFDSQLLHGKLAYDGLTETGNQNVKLVIGPWGHIDQESKFHNGEFIGEAADDIHLQTEYVRWFDHWLKGTETGTMDEPKVQLYARGTDQWYGGNTYPLEVTTRKKLYLNAENGASGAVPGKLDSDSLSIKSGYDQYRYDPGDLPEYQKGTKDKPGLFHDALAGREDYLLYKSPPLEKEVTLLGPMEATIFASSSAVDTDWFLTLVAMDENDRFTNYLSIGMLRARFRNSMEMPELLQKDQVYQFEISLSHCSFTLKKGQKIGLVISSSMMYPYFAKNLNTGKNNQTDTGYQVANQKIFHTAQYRSYISLSLMEREVQERNR